MEKGGDKRQSWGGGSGSQGSIMALSPERLAGPSGGHQGNRRERSTEAVKVSAESGDSLLRLGEAALGG